MDIEVNRSHTETKGEALRPHLDTLNIENKFIASAPEFVSPHSGKTMRAYSRRVANWDEAATYLNDHANKLSEFHLYAVVDGGDAVILRCAAEVHDDQHRSLF